MANITLVRKKKSGEFEHKFIKEGMWTNPSWKQKAAVALLKHRGFRTLEPGEEVTIKGEKKDIVLKGKAKKEPTPKVDEA